MTKVKPRLEPKTLAVRLLTLDAQHDQKIDKLEKCGIDASALRFNDLLDVALDLLGVPADNTSEMRERYGQKAYDRPDVICRDCFYNRWGETKKNQKGIGEFVEWVIHLVDSPNRN